MAAETCDVAIVGAGPAGIGAAVLLAEQDLRVLLIDENNRIGGQIWRRPVYTPTLRFGGLQTHAKPVGVTPGTLAHRNLRIITPACVLGVFPDKRLLLSVPGAKVNEIKARRIIFATGAREKVRPFKGWTLPGVMTLGAVQILLKQYGILAAPAILAAGAGPLIYALGGQVLGAGGVTTAILDRSHRRALLSGALVMAGQLSKIGQGLPLLALLIKNRVPVKHGMQIAEVTRQRHVLSVVAVKATSEGDGVPGSEQRYETQLLACGDGFVPNIELPQVAGCRLAYAADRGGWVVDVDAAMETSVPGVYAAGEITGMAGGDNALIEGRLAALSILRRFEKLDAKQYRINQASLSAKRRRCQRLGAFLNRQWRILPREWDQIDDTVIICRCEDITMGTIRSWIRKGITTAAELKRATRCGMGNCQGRTCAPLVYDILEAYGVAEKRNCQPLSVRTPVKPVPLGDLARLS